MPRALITTIDKTGPFFSKDPRKTFLANARDFLDEVADEGAADVIAQMLVGQAGRRPIRQLGDHVSEHVVGRTQSLRGRRWQYTAVVSVNNTGLTKAEGISLMAAASEVERQTGAFKRTSSRLRRVAKMNTSELLKGLG